MKSTVHLTKQNSVKIVEKSQLKYDINCWWSCCLDYTITL